MPHGGTTNHVNADRGTEIYKAALKVPRTTLQAWRMWHDTLDMCPHVADFFQSGPGLAFLHRLVIAFHLVCVEVGACGIRLVCLFLHLTGLNRFVAASYTYCISRRNFFGGKQLLVL